MGVHSWVARLNLRCDAEKRKDKEGRDRTLGDQAGKEKGGKPLGTASTRNHVWVPPERAA